MRKLNLRSRNAGITAAFAVTLLFGIAIERFVLSALLPVPKAEEAEPEEAESRDVSLTPERIQKAGIKVQRTSAGSLDDQIIAQATVVPTPAGAAIIGARADGNVASIAKRLGDSVRHGEVLGTLQSRDAARLSEEGNAAQARAVRARATFERQKNLLAGGATSRQDYDAAQAEFQIAEAELARARAASSASGVSRDGVSLAIISPISGRVTSASAVLGSYVVAGAELFRVADPSKLEVQASVPSADAQRVQAGSKAIIDLPQGAVEAVVRAITPDVGLQSRAATVVLVPSGNAASLQPGQFVSTRIKVTEKSNRPNSLLISADAIQKVDGEDTVFIRTKEGFRAQTIELGTRAGGVAEIRSGLKLGDEIATTNSFLLKAEMEKGSGGHHD